MRVPEEMVQAALDAREFHATERIQMLQALQAVLPMVRERLLGEEAVQVAAEKADEPYEWMRESPQEFIKKVLEAAFDAAFPEEDS